MEQITFGIVGAGWRTEFYLRIAKLSPERFKVSGMVVRDAEKGNKLEAEWGIQTFRDISSMMTNTNPTFVVTSVPWAANPDVMQALTDNGVPVLSETPPAPDLNGLTHSYEKLKDAKIQVAEQYWYQPLHHARLAIIDSGKLGTVTQAQVSAAHGYHGISLIRKLLGVQYENATIQASNFTSPIIDGPGRDGLPDAKKMKESNQIIASLQFDEKLGVLDFTSDQYFSWIRSPRVLVRGDKGEINNREVRYLKDYLTPIQMELKRMNAGEDGNLEGYYHKGVIAGEEWVYQNPFIPARLSDDEIAVATCLLNMDAYCKGGQSFYSLAEASQDHYLNLMVEQALVTKTTIKTETQAWALHSI